MKRLYIVRHGIAVDQGTPGFSDDERPLTEDGERKVREIARGLRKLDLEIERVVTSPLPRARATAELLARGLGLSERVELADTLRAGESAESIRGWLATRREEALMIVGHNPALVELIGLYLGLLGRNLPFTLKKGGLAAFRSDDGARFQLDWLAPSALVRGLSK